MSECMLDRRVSVAVVIGLLIGGLCVGVASRIPSNESDVGIPVNETIFADLVGVGLIPSFDMKNMTVYDSTYRIDSTLWDQPLLSESDAFEAAKAFLRHNINESFLENMHLNGSYLVDYRPTWGLLIDGSRISTTIWVNAISGDVIASSNFGPRTQGPLHPNGSDISAEEAEASAYSFLEKNNLSIPENARYMGTKRFSNSYTGFHTIFRHYEGQIFVGGSPLNELHPEGIHIHVDLKTAVIREFRYHWTEFGPIPTAGRISEMDAQTIALKECGLGPNLTVVQRDLVLVSVWSIQSTDGSPQLRLTWYITVNVPSVWDSHVSNHSGYRWELLVDAFSGEYLEGRGYNEIIDLPELPSYSIIDSLLILTLASISSALVGFSVYRFIRRELPPE